MPNKCENCPAYWFEQGLEDCDDGCLIRDLEKHVDNCRLPYFIRSMKVKIWKWQENRYWKKEAKKLDKETEYMLPKGKRLREIMGE